MEAASTCWRLSEWNPAEDIGVVIIVAVADYGCQVSVDCDGLAIDQGDQEQDDEGLVVVEHGED